MLYLIGLLNNNWVIFCRNTADMLEKMNFIEKYLFNYEYQEDKSNEFGGFVYKNGDSYIIITTELKEYYGNEEIYIKGAILSDDFYELNSRDTFYNKMNFVMDCLSKDIDKSFMMSIDEDGIMVEDISFIADQCLGYLKEKKKK